SVEAGRVVARLESDKTLSADALFYTVGRQANTDQLDLPAAGLKADARGRVAVDHQFRTAVSHIFAAGDAIGFPALASTSMEQGRRAALAMFGRSRDAQELPLPYGIYTIPEISMVGRTEQELTAGKVRYEVGIARYEELAKSQILGDHSGLLKLVFDPDSLKLLGVHCIGEPAAEPVQVHALGELEVIAELVLELLGHARVQHLEGDLPVVEQAARVEVVRPDRAPGAVDGKRLRVHHSRQPLEDLHAGLEQRS